MVLERRTRHWRKSAQLERVWFTIGQCHGRGFKTRYGHLSKILVKRGAMVDFRTKIGLIGNTGRSTGRHLHYEVVFNRRPINPFKFIMAGKYVYKDK